MDSTLWSITDESSDILAVNVVYHKVGEQALSAPSEELYDDVQIKAMFCVCCYISAMKEGLSLVLVSQSG